MRFWTLLSLISLAGGCFEPPKSMPVGQLGYTYGEIAAIAGLVCEFESQPDTPAPPDGPKPGDPCPSCEGRGYNGDGRHAVTCLDCDGTGKVLALKTAPPRRPVGGHFVPGGDGTSGKAPVVEERHDGDGNGNLLGHGSPLSYSEAYRDCLESGRPLVVLVCDDSPPCPRIRRVLDGVDLDVSILVEVKHDSRNGRAILAGTTSPQLVVYARNLDGHWRRWRLIGEQPGEAVVDAVQQAIAHTSNHVIGPGSNVGPPVTRTRVVAGGVVSRAVRRARRAW